MQEDVRDGGAVTRCRGENVQVIFVRLLVCACGGWLGL